MRLVPDDAWAVMTLWQEARGEPYRGQVAVGEVIRTRAETGYTSDGTIPGTVLRSRQFSGWNESDPNRIPAAMLDDADPLVQQLQRAWQESAAHAICQRQAVLYLNPTLVLARRGLLPLWATDGRDHTRLDRALVVTEIHQHAFLRARR